MAGNTIEAADELGDRSPGPAVGGGGRPSMTPQPAPGRREGGGVRGSPMFCDSPQALRPMISKHDQNAKQSIWIITQQSQTNINTRVFMFLFFLLIFCLLTGEKAEWRIFWLCLQSFDHIRSKISTHEISTEWVMSNIPILVTRFTLVHGCT